MPNWKADPDPADTTILVSLDEAIQRYGEWVVDGNKKNIEYYRQAILKTAGMLLRLTPEKTMQIVGTEPIEEEPDAS